MKNPNVNQVITTVTVPNIIKKSSDIDPKNFKILMKSMALRLALESTLITIFEMSTFKHVKNIFFIPNHGPRLTGLADIAFHPDISYPKYTNYDHIAKNSGMTALPLTHDKIVEEFSATHPVQFKNNKKLDPFSFSHHLAVDPHVYILRFNHIISVVFEDSFYSLSSKEKKSLIKKLQIGLKRSRDCARMVKSTERRSLEVEMRSVFRDKHFYQIDRDNYQDVVSNLMPYGWGANREGILINEAIIAGLPSQNTIIKKNKL